jgi:hypothetical protein
VLPDKFVAGGIIAKLPLSWKNFATSLKHKRQRFNVADLIGTLDVEERARAKERHGRVFSLLVPMRYRRKIPISMCLIRKKGKEREAKSDNQF